MDNYLCYDIEEFDILESTNTFLCQRAKEGEDDRKVIVARSQTSGRGRRGKSFFSSRGSGLYMSILTRKAVSLDSLSFLTPAVACAVARAIERVSHKECGIKWVNDIFIDSKKVSGILTETKCDFDKGVLEYAVIGIGVNLCAPVGGYPKDIENIAGALFDDCDDCIRYELLKAILEELDIALSQLETQELLDEYRSRSILDGKEIEIMTPDGTVSGVAVEVDGKARLVVEINGERQALSSGDVSIKVK